MTKIELIKVKTIEYLYLLDILKQNVTDETVEKITNVLNELENLEDND